MNMEFISGVKLMEFVQRFLGLRRTSKIFLKLCFMIEKDFIFK
jgi:hypothetical protein